MQEKDEIKPIIEDSTLEGFAKLMRQASGTDNKDNSTMKSSSDTPKGYADGGVVSSALQALLGAFNPMAPGIAQGTADAINSPVGQAVTQALPNATNPMALGLANAVGASVQTPPQGAPNMSEGPNVGNVQNGATAPATPPSGAPPMGQMMQKLQQTPPTNPGIYQGISADDRAKLMQSLLNKQSSGGNLAAQAVGGLGDAISNSFGHGGQHAMQDVRDITSKNVENRIGVVDTQRQQKLQDLQANIAQQEADPNSAYSGGMRQFLSQLTGKPMPSGISASMIKTIFPDYAKIFDAKMQSTTAAGQQGIEAGKALTDEGFFSRIANAITGNKGADYLESRVGGGSTSQTSAPVSTDGWSVKR